MADEGKNFVRNDGEAEPRKTKGRPTIERKEGAKGVLRERSGFEPRRKEERLKDISEIFPTWDREAEQKFGQRDFGKDRRKGDRRSTLGERRGTSKRFHRATDRPIERSESDTRDVAGGGTISQVIPEQPSFPPVIRRPADTTLARIKNPVPTTPKPTVSDASTYKARVYKSPVAESKTSETPAQPSEKSWVTHAKKIGLRIKSWFWDHFGGMIA